MRGPRARAGPGANRSAERLAESTGLDVRGNDVHVAKALGVSRATLYRHTDVTAARTQR